MSRPLRVLHVHSDLRWGGVETWIANVVKFADPRRFTFDILAAHAEPHYQEAIERRGCRVLAGPRPSSLLRFRRRLADVLRAGEYDVIHSHYIDHSGSIMQMGARAGVPVRVVHCHNDLAPVWADASLVRRSYFRLMNRLIRRCATAGLAASAGAASTMFGSEWPSDGRWMLLPYGIDLRPFRNGVGRAATRMSLGIPANAFVVAHVGRFVPQKNHAFLLEVISATVAVTRDACFLLVGEGPDEAAFERAASTRGLSGCIVRVSGRPDVPDLLAAADAFAFPSRFEGLGIAAVEAQAAGLPCVLSDRVPSEACVVPELVDRLPLSSPEAWAAALVASRSRPALPAALALETVSRSLMNIDRSIAVLESVYDSGRRSKAAVA